MHSNWDLTEKASTIFTYNRVVNTKVGHLAHEKRKVPRQGQTAVKVEQVGFSLKESLLICWQTLTFSGALGLWIWMWHLLGEYQLLMDR